MSTNLLKEPEGYYQGVFGTSGTKRRGSDIGDVDDGRKKLLWRKTNTGFQSFRGQEFY